jgi:DNA-directed RNA polymerase specialized sigma24 family protein
MVVVPEQSTTCPYCHLLSKENTITIRYIFFLSQKSTIKFHDLLNVNSFNTRHLVELSALDENKLNCLIAYKLTAPLPQPDHHSHYSPCHISAQGEIVASALKQIHKHLAPEEIEEIVLAYQSGKSAEKLASEYGCNRTTICNHLKKHGIKIGCQKIKSEEQLQEIITLYKRGQTTTELAALTGISASAIQKYLHKNGVKMRGRWG